METKPNPVPALTQEGMVTAEAAVTIPTVVAVALFLITVTAAVGMRAQACVVAGQMGRAQAVGETYVAPAHYLVSTTRVEGAYLRTQVTLQHRLESWLPIQCEVVTREEGK